MESLFVLSDEKGNDEPKIGCEMNIVPDQLACGQNGNGTRLFASLGIAGSNPVIQLISEMNILLLLTWYVA